YIAFFGATWLPLPWLYPAEINPLKTRAKANSVSTISNWLWNFFIVMVTPVMINGTGQSGWGTYLFFAILNALFFPIIYFFYPEVSSNIPHNLLELLLTLVYRLLDVHSRKLTSFSLRASLRTCPMLRLP